MAEQILFPQSDNVVSFEDCKRKGLPTASPLSEARCLDELMIQASAKFRFFAHEPLHRTGRRLECAEKREREKVKETKGENNGPKRI